MARSVWLQAKGRAVRTPRSTRAVSPRRRLRASFSGGVQQRFVRIQRSCRGVHRMWVVSQTLSFRAPQPRHVEGCDPEVAAAGYVLMNTLGRSRMYAFVSPQATLLSEPTRTPFPVSRVGCPVRQELRRAGVHGKHRLR
jgi:hypothetical protein